MVMKMKIQIIGYSGSGKSTLAKLLSKHYNIPALHLDSINFLPNWKERPRDEFNNIVKEFIENNDSWIIDGTYSSVARERYEMADLIIFLNYNRFFCYRSAKKRAKAYKNKTRPDMAEGCQEKFDKEFRRWILFEGRTKKRRMKYKELCKMGKGYLVFKNRKALHKYLEALCISCEK